MAIRESVVVVVIQYRLGVFGFAGSNLLKSRDADNSTGNYGLQDQRFALQWVKDNIEYFGGDPNNVVLFGQSSGGYSVGLHMVAPESAGLFQKAIIADGGVPTWLPYNLYEASDRFIMLINSTSCGPKFIIGSDLPGVNGTDNDNENLNGTVAEIVDCMEALPSKELLLAQEEVLGMMGGNFPVFAPVIDHYEFKEHPVLLMAKGNFSNVVPLIIGTNENDGSIYNSLPYNATMDDVMNYMDKLFNVNRATRLLAAYDVESFDTPWDLLTHILGDFMFSCPSENIVQKLTALDSPVFVYEFQHRSLLPRRPLCTGVCLGEELQYVFPDIFPKFGLGEDKLAQRVEDLWGTFARLGKPTYTAAFVNETDNSTAIDYTLNWRAVNETAGLPGDYYLRLDTPPNIRLLKGYHLECDDWGDLLLSFVNQTLLADSEDFAS